MIGWFKVLFSLKEGKLICVWKDVNLGELIEIILSAPSVEVFGPQETTAADERAAIVDMIEDGGSHAAIARGRGEGVNIGAKNAFEAAVLAARVEGKEITFALEAGDIGISREQFLIGGVEQP